MLQYISRQVRRPLGWVRTGLVVLVLLLHHHCERATGGQYGPQLLDASCAYCWLDYDLVGGDCSGKCGRRVNIW